MLWYRHAINPYNPEPPTVALVIACRSKQPDDLYTAVLSEPPRVSRSSLRELPANLGLTPSIAYQMQRKTESCLSRRVGRPSKWLISRADNEALSAVATIFLTYPSSLGQEVRVRGESTRGTCEFRMDLLNRTTWGWSDFRAFVDRQIDIRRQASGLILRA